ncbi:MAG: S8 family peptidase [Bacteroidales bacterium]|jgi:subtilisin family serine protease|nr:S8 family peptidase [Bacteroidales bacterium]
MKNKFFIFTMLSLSIIAVMSFTPSNNQRFYYAYNEKIYLNELDNKLIVRYKHSKKSDKGQISLSVELAAKQFEWKDDSTCIITIDASEKGMFEDRILHQTDVKSCNPVFSINTGLEMGVTDEFLLKFNDNVSQTEIEKLHKKYGVEVIKTTELYQLIKTPAGLDALEIANKYQESGLTRFSHPNFICEMELHQVIPNDPYFVNQFSLHNTGQVFTDGHLGTNDADIDAPEAWTITQGNNNIIIAVLDQGLTPDHPDLPNARQVRLSGSNFADGDPNNPSPTGNNNHGNSCAGIIGATQNNNQGISGIAPNCRIMPIRIFNNDGSGITPDRLVDAINFARNNGAHIISNSWGYNSDNPNLYPVIRDAIINATTQGRNGLGCVVVFSAGNNLANNGPIHFPSNVNVSGVLTVGASDRNDFKAFYSPLANPASPNNQLLDIVAPSHRAYSCQISTETFEAWSIDIPDNAGYNPIHDNDCGMLPGVGTILPNAGVNNLSYTGRFGGTSYSCPQVAGVAALILSINPNLTQQQVFDILTTSADRVGGYVYSNGQSNELGFGRLNACKAVTQTISTITSINGVSTLCNSSIYSINNLPVNCSVNWNITPSGIVNLAQSNNTATLTKTNNGIITLSATISTIGANYTQTKIIIIGSPTPTITARKISESGEPTEYEFTATLISGSTYNWYVNNILKESNPYPNNLFYWYFPANVTKTIKCNITNSCGTSAFSNSITKTGEYKWGHNYSIYPNPANSEITISQIEIKDANLNEKQETPKLIKSIKIIDNLGVTYIVKNFENETYNTTINISNLPHGIYLIKINEGEETESYTLLKN